MAAHCNITAPVVDDYQITSVHIDAMALIQSFPHSQLSTTFDQLAHKLRMSVISLGSRFKAARIDVVIDRYDNVSIKNLERDMIPQKPFPFMEQSKSFPSNGQSS